jgi:hypothetical protein
MNSYFGCQGLWIVLLSTGNTHTHSLYLSLSLSSLLPFREQPISLCMNVKGERVSLPVVPMSYRNLSGDAQKADVGVDQLLLAGWLAMVCVCVCVWERERERERKSVEFRVDLFKALSSSYLVLWQSFQNAEGQCVLGAFPGTHLFLVPFPSTTLTYLSMKEGR